MKKSLRNSNFNVKFQLYKNMPNYNCFHINCYLKVTCNILFFYPLIKGVTMRAIFSNPAG